MAETSSVACPYCGESASHLFLASATNLIDVSEGFDYYRCPRCHWIFLYPIPSDLSRYYTQSYYSIPDSLDSLTRNARTQHYKLDTVQDHARSGRLLEIGAAYGDFAFLARQAGYTVDAIEMDRACCTFLEQTVGIRAFHSDDPIQTLSNLESYDIIVLWQVIEHLPNPVAALQTIVQHLTPGGILVFSAPNPSSLQFWLFGRQWAHLDAPRHLNLIPIPVLQQVLEQLGMRRLAITTRDGEADKMNGYGWKKSLMNVLGVQVSPPTVPVKTDASPRPLSYRVKRGALRFVAGMIQLLAIPFERSGQRGSSYTFIFQKPT